MTDSDRPAFSETIGALAVAFRQEATTPLLRAYWLGLSDLALADVREAATRALRSLKFMPTVAELRDLAGDLNKSDRAEHAWSVFERAVVTYGRYKSVSFDDPIINATVRAHGGWVRCCDLPAEEFDKWLRREWIKTYAAFCNHPPSDEAMQPLAGSHARTNGVLGFDHPSNKPIQIVSDVRPLIAPPEQRERLAASGLAKQIADQRRLK